MLARSSSPARKRPALPSRRSNKKHPKGCFLVLLPDQSLILSMLSDTEYLRGVAERLEYIAEMRTAVAV